MNKKDFQEIFNLLKIYILPIIMVPLIIFGIMNIMGLIIWTPDIYYKLKFEMQVITDKRIKKMSHFEAISDKYNRNSRHRVVNDKLENKQNILSPAHYKPFPEEMLLYALSEDDDIQVFIEKYINEIKIYNKNDMLILDKQDLLNASMPFIHNTQFKEDYPGELDWTGSYYFIITKQDLKKKMCLLFHIIQQNG